MALGKAESAALGPRLLFRKHERRGFSHTSEIKASKRTGYQKSLVFQSSCTSAL